MHAELDSPTPVLPRLRVLLLALVVFGALGLFVELLLMEHWEEWQQRIPLALLGLTGVLAGLLLIRPGPGLLRVFRTVMILAVLSGVAGAVLHYLANAQLEQELNPDRPFMEIVREALGGGVPTLAPGAMIQLGLLGLLAVFRHPAGRGRPDSR